jgi:hypothetical protein
MKSNAPLQPIRKFWWQQSIRGIVGEVVEKRRGGWEGFPSSLTSLDLSLPPHAILPHPSASRVPSGCTYPENRGNLLLMAKNISNSIAYKIIFLLQVLNFKSKGIFVPVLKITKLRVVWWRYVSIYSNSR